MLKIFLYVYYINMIVLAIELNMVAMVGGGSMVFLLVFAFKFKVSWKDVVDHVV